MMQERERSRESASTISGKRRVKSLPGRLYSLTRSPSLRAMIRNPSCLISCSHRPPDGSVWTLVGRHDFDTLANSGDLAKAAKRQRRHWNREAALERRENMVEI